MLELEVVRNNLIHEGVYLIHLAPEKRLASVQRDLVMQDDIG